MKPGVWFRVQSEAWGEGASYGLTAVRKTVEAFSSPFTSPTNVITAASVMAMLLMIYFAWVKRLPLPMVAYSAGDPRLDAAAQHGDRPPALPVHGVPTVHLRSRVPPHRSA